MHRAAANDTGRVLSHGPGRDHSKALSVSREAICLGTEIPSQRIPSATHLGPLSLRSRW